MNTVFNRNVIFLNFADEVLKLEYTYFPFPQIESPKVIEGVKIDSVIDIATNKLFTIYQKPRSRDFMDLYMINKKYNYDMDMLISKARSKFDWHVDPIKLGAQFFLCTELKDYPRLLENLGEDTWQKYFLDEAKKFKKDIVD